MITTGGYRYWRHFKLDFRCLGELEHDVVKNTNNKINTLLHEMVTDAILQGVQNYCGERKIYSKCMKKVGSFDAR